MIASDDWNCSLAYTIATPYCDIGRGRVLGGGEASTLVSRSKQAIVIIRPTGATEIAILRNLMLAFKEDQLLSSM